MPSTMSSIVSTVLPYSTLTMPFGPGAFQRFGHQRAQSGIVGGDHRNGFQFFASRTAGWRSLAGP